MDEPLCADSAELLIILAAIADEGIPCRPSLQVQRPLQQSVDYVGDVEQFEREMALDVAAIAYAVRNMACRKSQAERSLRQR